MVKKSTVDKDLKRIIQLEKATAKVGQNNINLGISVLFLIGVLIFAAFQITGLESGGILIVAAIIGGYMALNIGANDVANNVGPAVGSKAITLVGALIIAAVFESAGAIIAGGDVVTTISKNIINPEAVSDKNIFIWAMMSALLAAAIWVNIATYVGAPVSTTHAVVGGVLGAGVAAAGLAAVNWPVMAKIAASWVISPVLGALVAAGFLGFAKYFILYKEDKLAAARRWVPVLVAILASAFSVYLVMKGLKRVWKPEPYMIAMIGVGAFAIGYALVRPAVAKASATMPNRRKSVSDLFTIPLICAAALLSFAHGANDVANAVGPLAAIVSAVTAGTVAAKVTLPIWVLIVGAVGISIGLMLFGPKVIEIVGEKITKLNRVRAFCVALSAAITVIIASAFGLPVSSTHIAVGAVCGVGFLREFLVNKNKPMAAAVANGEISSGQVSWEETPLSTAKNLKKAKKAQKRKLVRRRHLVTIVAAWVITVPAAAILSGLIFLALREMLQG
jgi:PiT family inorganic phosphate transporter